MKTTQWICDECRQPIVDPEEGFLEWMRKFSDETEFGMHLVHNKTGCLYERKKGFADIGNHLPYFLGHDGLTQLLQLLYDNLIPREEVIEMIKRLHTPGYESARLYFDSAISEGELEPRHKDHFYTQETIGWVNKWGKKRDTEND